MNDENLRRPSFEPADVKPPVAAGAPSSDAWRKVHPLTPLMRSWSTVAALITIVTIRSEDAIRSFTGRLTHTQSDDSGGVSLSHVSTRLLLLSTGVLLALLVVLLLLNWIAWRATSFRLTESTVEVRRGVVVKQHRHARLDRVQAIDVEQPFVPRLFGLAALSFDVAGSGSSHLRISMLKRSDAEALRESMLASVRAAHTADRGSGHEPPEVTFEANSTDIANVSGPQGGMTVSTPARGQAHAPRTPGGRLVETLTREGLSVGDDLTSTLSSTFAAYGPRPAVGADGRIVHVPPHRVVLAGLLRVSTFIGLAWFVFGLVALVIGLNTGEGRTAGTIAITTTITAFGFLNSNVQRALKQANFSAALTPDGLLITQGVTSTERRLIPLDRIQAVGLEQPLLWRPFGWWKAHYNVATHGSTEESVRSSTLLPVGTARDALTMLAFALPLTPAGEQDPELSDDVFLDAMSSSPKLLEKQPHSSKWLDPLSWRVNGWRITPSLTLIRRGRVKRRVECLPHARLQSLGLYAGPLQRRLGLAHLTLHSTSGPLDGTMPRQAAPRAREVFFELAETARDARTAEQARGAMTTAR